MVSNERPACASANKGPSYGELVAQHNEVIAKIYEKVDEIQSKLVPPFELPPKEPGNEGPNDPTLFGALVREFHDLSNIEQVLDTIIRIL